MPAYILAGMYIIAITCSLLTVCFILAGIKNVKSKYEFMWTGEDEGASYPSVILDNFLYLGEEESALEKVCSGSINPPYIIPLSY